MLLLAVAKHLGVQAQSQDISKYVTKKCPLAKFYKNYFVRFKVVFTVADHWFIFFSYFEVKKAISLWAEVYKR